MTRSFTLAALVALACPVVARADVVLPGGGITLTTTPVQVLTALPASSATPLPANTVTHSLHLTNASDFHTGVTVWCAWGSVTPAPYTAGSFPLGAYGNQQGFPVAADFSTASNTLPPAALTCMSDGGSSGTATAQLTVRGW